MKYIQNISETAAEKNKHDFIPVSYVLYHTMDSTLCAVGLNPVSLLRVTVGEKHVGVLSFILMLVLHKNYLIFMLPKFFYSSLVYVRKHKNTTKQMNNNVM